MPMTHNFTFLLIIRTLQLVLLLCLQLWILFTLGSPQIVFLSTLPKLNSWSSCSPTTLKAHCYYPYFSRHSTPTDSTRNLGFIFDKDLSAKAHISSVCKRSYFQIRKLRQVRSSLDKNSAIILANSLVSSKLDYCNSLYYNLPAVSLDRLQKVQNALARVVVPSVRRHHHITPTLKTLHWNGNSSTNFLQNCCHYLQNASKSATFIPTCLISLSPISQKEI